MTLRATADPAAYERVPAAKRPIGGDNPHHQAAARLSVLDAQIAPFAQVDFSAPRRWEH